MTVERLVKIIDEEAGEYGTADGNKVKALYGEGFNDVNLQAIRGGLYEMSGPVGSITLSAKGKALARR